MLARNRDSLSRTTFTDTIKHITHTCARLVAGWRAQPAPEVMNVSWSTFRTLATVLPIFTYNFDARLETSNVVRAIGASRLCTNDVISVKADSDRTIYDASLMVC